MSMLLHGRGVGLETWMGRLGMIVGVIAALAGGAFRVGAQPLVWDDAFAPDVVHRAGSEPEVRATAMADGSYLITGDATHVDGRPVPGILRLGADGALDAGFAFGGEALRHFDLVATLDGGRFLVVHRADPADGAGTPVIRRYEASGALDSSFAEVPIDGTVLGVERMSDGAIVVHGWFFSVGGQARAGLARFTSTGALDGAYAPQMPGVNVTVEDVAAAPAGALIARVHTGGLREVLMRIDASGQHDPGFVAPQFAYGRMLLVQRDGRVIFGGGRPLRLGADGTADAGFSPLPPPGWSMTSTSLEGAVELADGELVFEVVAFSSWSNFRELLRYTSEGVRIGPWSGAGALHGLTPDGRILTRVAGQSEWIDRHEGGSAFLTPAPQFVVYPGDGGSPVVLRPDLGFPGTVSAVEIDGAGGVWVAGPFSWIDGHPRPGLARLGADGAVDAAFQPPADLGRLWPGVRQPDGHVWVYARETSDAWWRRLRRLAPDGSLASTGTVESDLGRSHARVLGLDREGRILAAVLESADGPSLRLARFDATTGARLATLPPVFGGSFTTNELLDPILVTEARELDDGSIVFAGAFSQVDGQPASQLVRLKPDGTVDPDYLARVAEHGSFYVQALQRDGAVLVLWYGTSYLPQRVIRLRPDGAADTEFVVEGAGEAPTTLLPGMMELPDRTLVRLRAPLERWRADGSRVLVSNAASGMTVLTVAQAADGDWVIGGEFGALRLQALTTPGIVIPPVARSVASGERAEFSVEVGDAGPATFQWQRDGVDLAGATRSTLVIPAASAAEAGVYRVIIRVGPATYVSDGVTLTVRPSTAHLVNFSARSRVPMGGPPQIAGFVVAGDAPRRVLLRAIGLEIPSLVRYRTRLMDPALALFAGETFLASDARSARAPELLELARRVGAFEPALWEVIPGISINYDSALAWDLGAGSYTLQTSSPSNAAGISLAEFYDAGEGAPLGFVRNMSLRGRTAAGEDTLIGGFIVRGEGALLLLVRVVGPELAHFGVGQVLEDPRLRLYRDGMPIGSNDSWDDRPAEELAALVGTSQSVGAFALSPGSQSAASLVQVLPGAYTVHAESVTGVEGEVLLELYVIDERD